MIRLSWYLWVGIPFCARPEEVEVPAILWDTLAGLSLEDLEIVAGVQKGTARDKALHHVVTVGRQPSLGGAKGPWTVDELMSNRPWLESSGSLAEVIWTRLIDEPLTELRPVESRERFDSFEVVSTPWSVFQGPTPAKRALPQLFGPKGEGPNEPDERCQKILVNDFDWETAGEQWRGVQPRPEVIEVQRLSNVFVTYNGQIFDRKALFNDVMFKVDHMHRQEPAVSGSGLDISRNVSAFLFPIGPGRVPGFVKKHGFPEGWGSIVDGVLFRELGLYGHGQCSHLDHMVPWVTSFPPGKTLIPFVDQGLLNYGHWSSMALTRLAAMWDIVKDDPNTVFLIYDSIFALDTMRYLLGSDFGPRRVKKYNACALYYADKVLAVGPEYHYFVDNLSKESAERIRGVFLPFRFPRPEPPREDTRAPIRKQRILWLNRAEAVTRGRSTLNFQDALRTTVQILGDTHAVIPMICGDNTMQGQIQFFSEADIVIGLDGACFGNALWMKPGSVIVTIIPSKRNYIPIMPVKDCGYTYAWKILTLSGCVLWRLCSLTLMQTMAFGFQSSP